MLTKMNLGLAISVNYNKVTLEFLDESIEHETDEILKAKIRKKFTILREEIINEFARIKENTEKAIK